MTDPKKQVQQLLKSTKTLALGTLENGRPYVSATGYIYGDSGGSLGEIYLLLSDLARHSKNIAKDPHVSLLIVEPKEDLPIHERKRVTLSAELRVIQDEKQHARLRSQYIDQFPRSEIFFSLPDFRFYQAEVSEIHWIGGFGQAASWEMKPSELGKDLR